MSKTTQEDEPGRTAYEARFAGFTLGPRGVAEKWEDLLLVHQAIWARVEEASQQPILSRLAEHVVKRAQAGNSIMRLRFALLVLTDSTHHGAIQLVRKWFSEGADGPVPFHPDFAFTEWASRHDISNVDGFMGYRTIVPMTTPTSAPAEGRAG